MFLNDDPVKGAVKMMPALHKKSNQCPDNIPLVLKDWHFVRQLLRLTIFKVVSAVVYEYIQ